MPVSSDAEQCWTISYTLTPNVRHNLYNAAYANAAAAPITQGACVIIATPPVLTLELDDPVAAAAEPVELPDLVVLADDEEPFVDEALELPVDEAEEEDPVVDAAVLAALPTAPAVTVTAIKFKSEASSVVADVVDIVVVSAMRPLMVAWQFAVLEPVTWQASSMVLQRCQFLSMKVNGIHTL